MKRFIALTILMLAGVIGASAQNHPQTANEGYVGYTFLRQDVKFERPSFKFDENTDSHGLVVAYTRYLGGNASKVGVFGLTGEVGANFDTNEANLATAMAGFTLKARNVNYVQPSVKVLGGVARQHVNRQNILDTTDVSGAFSAGVGLDFQDKRYARYKLHVGADYINTGFNGERQHAVRLTTGLVF